MWLRLTDGTEGVFLLQAQWLKLHMNHEGNEKAGLVRPRLKVEFAAYQPRCCNRFTTGSTIVCRQIEVTRLHPRSAASRPGTL